MQWGDVFWSKGRDRHAHVVITSSGFEKKWSRVLVARCTMHTTSRKATAGTLSALVDQPCLLGEAPVLYPDVSRRDRYPETNRVQLSLVQGYNIQSEAKADLLDPRRHAFAGTIDGQYRGAISSQLHDALHGIARPPRQLCVKQPLWCNGVEQGAVHMAKGVSGGTYVVVSHDKVHRYYPFSNLILIPVLDWSKANVYERYSFQCTLTCNVFYDPTALTDEPIAYLTKAERIEVRDALSKVIEAT